MGEQLLIRFRHTQGDVGPLSMPASLTVQQAKERLFAAWPRGITYVSAPEISHRISVPSHLKL